MFVKKELGSKMCIFDIQVINRNFGTNLGLKNRLTLLINTVFISSDLICNDGYP